jgi:hypothetical protein
MVLLKILRSSHVRRYLSVPSCHPQESEYTEFICDTLTNSCHANQAAKDLCANATQAAAAAAAKTGVQADVFNAMFSIITVGNSLCILQFIKLRRILLGFRCCSRRR